VVAGVSGEEFCEEGEGERAYLTKVRSLTNKAVLADFGTQADRQIWPGVGVKGAQM